MIGTLLGGRYEILELIGTGGMANVYKARCTMLNRFVAIKVLKDEFSHDQDFIKRFNIESQAAAGLSHSNIVSVYDVGTQENIHYIVMEYVDGITLKKYMEEHGALSVEEAINFSIQIASALNHAHRKGIIHRDIKPQNILVTKDKQLKVTDFGIARAVSSYTMKIEDGAMCTAHYCSPEQASGRYTDEKSDIYSLGVVMYEMLTGRLPFESDNSVSVAIKQIQEEPVRPSEINPLIPKNVEDVVLKAMKKDQSERFQTASEMLIELNYINNGVKISKEKEELSGKFETKVINIKNKDSKSKNSDIRTAPKKEEAKKEDKVAVVAAIISSVVVVSLICFLAISFMFPTILPWNKLPDVAEGKAPNLIGVKYEQAVKKYKNIEFIEEEAEYSNLYDEGYIIRQSPDPGEDMEKPYKIKVVVSKGAKIVPIPKLENVEYREAEMKLDELEILYTVTYETSSTVPEDIVIKVSPSAGTKVKAGTDMVTLTVSSGNEKKKTEVPNVVGKTRSEAEKIIEKSGFTFTVKKVNSSKEEGTVVEQSLSAGSMAEEKANIVISVSNGHKDDSDNDGNDSQTGTKPSGNEGGTGTAEQPKTSVKELTVSLPSDRDTATVKITVNGQTVYEKTHNTSEGAVSVPIKGSGSTTVAYYIDGAKVGERTIQF